MAGGWRSPFFLGIGGAPAGSGPPVPVIAWTLGALWSLSVTCAKSGTFGLKRTADGITASSDVTSTKPFAVTAGETLFTSFWARSGVGTDGQIGVGYAFRDVANVLLGYSFVETTIAPSVWTQFVGNIAVPTLAVTATPVVRAFNNLAGIWCVDVLSAFAPGGNFVLSAIKHYYDSFTAWR